jgi:tRNA (guanine37-N1)-methyltransferase
MNIHIVTAFPDLLAGPLNESIIRRAQDNNAVRFNLVDLRDFTSDRYRSVDDYPYGGGPGMIMKPEPFFRAVDDLKAKGAECNRVIMMTPQGRRFNQQKARAFTGEKELVILCGHYKGVDERVREALVTEEISIGDYILTGGELPALVVIDAVVRLLPDVLGDADSANSDSFETGLLDCGYYTRPEVYRGMSVPEVLLSGHHAEIEKWRKSEAIARTRTRRGDLYDKYADRTLDGG